MYFASEKIDNFTPITIVWFVCVVLFFMCALLPQIELQYFHHCDVDSLYLTPCAR